MKKIFKFISIMFINIILIFILAETLCYYCITGFPKISDFKNFNIRNSIDRIQNIYNTFQFKTYDETYKYIKEERFVKPIGLNYKTRPILIFGCSFAYGYGLDVKDSLAGKLSELMKRPVYNRAFEWLWSPSNMLYQARRADFYNEVPNPEYIIYVVMYDHIFRISSKFNDTQSFYPPLYYKMKNGKLEEEKWKLIDNLYISKKFGNLKLRSWMSHDDLYKNFNEFFIETKEELDKHWKDYKFVILFYDIGPDWSDNFPNQEQLKQNGFIIIKTADLINRYLDQKDDVIEDNLHPSPKVWAEITPNLIKELEKLK